MGWTWGYRVIGPRQLTGWMTSTGFAGVRQYRLAARGSLAGRTSIAVFGWKAERQAYVEDVDEWQPPSRSTAPSAAGAHWRSAPWPWAA